ncbi:MAG: hypothetical protein NZ585_11755 [Chloracidobacterium sp.]|nr:hypothetical protein [Chloracidobacterium sp.]MDW8218256.1 hypothetical protein [Acidobacteriota bacterium]
MSIFERIRRYLLEPSLSRAFCALTAEGVVVFDRRSRRSVFRPWTEAAFQPGLDTENVRRPEIFAEVLREAVQAVGLAGERRWSVLAPGATARMHVVTLDAAIPWQDTPEVLLWKAERLTGLDSSEVWMTTVELSRTVTGERRFLMAVMSRRVALDLQAQLRRLNWRPGLLLPNLICEALWLRRATGCSDQMLIRVEEDTLAVMLLREGAPVAIRMLPLAGEAPAEQLLRLLLFFREHAAESGLPVEAGPLSFEVLAVNTPLEAVEIEQCVAETFGATPRLIEPRQLGFASPTEFSRLAGVVGLALATA